MRQRRAFFGSGCSSADEESSELKSDKDELDEFHRSSSDSSSDEESALDLVEPSSDEPDPGSEPWSAPWLNLTALKAPGEQSSPFDHSLDKDEAPISDAPGSVLAEPHVVMRPLSCVSQQIVLTATLQRLEML
ncbi:hypothetical protein N7494_008397 [Penicillium frequentans]|uniref:Uncharacterized protein n=1 Tax=Penicillium frequentans TaxID=3151616 RepID=A0AAD6GDL3_9EURO|nr:hypothetical protein N7494_008397 [Penicillium glabrum]